MDLALTYANYETVMANAYVSGGVTDNIAVNLAGHVASRNDGWGRNTVTGAKTYTYSDRSLRGKLLWEPGSTTKVLLAADYDDYEGVQGVLRTAIPGTVTGGATPNRGFYNVSNSADAENRVKSGGASLRIDQDLDAVSVTSITAYRRGRQSVIYDLDTSPLNSTVTTLETELDTFTQELQVKSPSGSNIDWIVGAFYFNDDTAYNPLGIRVGGATQIFRYNAQKSESLAGFGQAKVPLGDTTSVTVGLRYTHDKRKLRGRQTVNGAGGDLPDQSASFDKLTWRLAIDQKITPDVMVYVSYNRGFKSGVFDVTDATSPAVNPEVLDAFEAGLKSDFFDRRLRINLAAFHYKYSDIQVTQVLAGTARVLNAGKARINGIEGDITAVPFDGLTLNGGFSILDAKYTKFPNGPHFSPNGAAPTCTVIPYPANAPGGQTQVSGCDLSGNRMVFAPPFSGNIAATYKLETGGGSSWIANASYFYTNSFPFEADGSVKQKGYGLLSASLEWRSSGDDLGLRIWGKNLTKEEYFAAANSTSAGRIYSAGEPRTYGVTLTYSY